MMPEKLVRMYCRRCRKMVGVYESYREEKVYPEENPVFDVVTWSCNLCHQPIIEVSELRRPRG